MKKFYSGLSLIVFICSSLCLSSCYKNILKDNDADKKEETSIHVKDSSEVKKLLVAQTWQIEEVVDPFSGVRYKRGSVSDGKEFNLALYTYHENGLITGTDWFGNPINNNRYSLQDHKFIIIAPDCSSVNEIIFISSEKFTYKANDGSVFTLTPVNVSTGNKQ